MQKFNKAFAPSTAKPSLRRQKEAAGERKKEWEKWDGEGEHETRGAGPVTTWARLSRPGAAHFPVVGVMRVPWPLDDTLSNIESILAIKNAVYQPVQPREAVRVKGASRPLINVNCQAAFLCQVLLLVHRG